MATTHAPHRTVELPVEGMDCAGCTRTVQQALVKVPGVFSAEVLLSAEKAVIEVDPARVDDAGLRRAVEGAGYRVPEPHVAGEESATAESGAQGYTRQVLGLFGIVFAVVLFVVVLGEWFGMIDAVTERVPFPIGVLIVAAFGYPVFRNVIQGHAEGQGHLAHADVRWRARRVGCRAVGNRGGRRLLHARGGLRGTFHDRARSPSAQGPHGAGAEDRARGARRG